MTVYYYAGKFEQVLKRMRTITMFAFLERLLWSCSSLPKWTKVARSCYSSNARWMWGEGWLYKFPARCWSISRRCTPQRCTLLFIGARFCLLGMKREDDLHIIWLGIHSLCVFMPGRGVLEGWGLGSGAWWHLVHRQQTFTPSHRLRAYNNCCVPNRTEQSPT